MTRVQVKLAYRYATGLIGLVAVLFMLLSGFAKVQWITWALVVGGLAVVVCAVVGTVEGICDLGARLRRRLRRND